MFRIHHFPLFILILLVLAVADVFVIFFKDRRKQAAEAERRAAEKAAAEEAARRAELEKERAKAAKAAEKERRQAETERRRAERLEAARQLAEYKERAAQAQRELNDLQRGQTVSPAALSSPVSPAADPVPADHSDNAAGTFAPAAESAPAPRDMTLQQFAQTVRAKNLPQTFAGKFVSFTGKIDGMTRAQAIDAVRARGGKAFDTTHLPKDANMLVVGHIRGEGTTRKFDQAGERVEQVQTITAAQFLAMIEA